MTTQAELFDTEKIYKDFYPKVYQYLVNRMGSIEDAEDIIADIEQALKEATK